MAEDSAHRLRWLLIAVLLVGGIAYLVRSRQAELPEAAPWQPPEPARDRPLRSTATPAVTARRIPAEPPPAPAADRPSPRPRRTATAELPAGAAAALPDGSPPGPEYTVKAKAGSTLFHGPDSPYFGRTRAEFWFRTAADARAAGLTEWTPRRRSAD